MGSALASIARQLSPPVAGVIAVTLTSVLDRTSVQVLTNKCTRQAVAERVLLHFPHAGGPQLRGAAKNEKFQKKFFQNCFFLHIFPSICLKKR